MITAPETPPRPQQLAPTLKQMVEAGCFQVVLELATRALAEQRFWGLRFNTLVFTNWSTGPHSCQPSGHCFQQLLGSLEPVAVLIANADDPATVALAAATAASAVTYGTRSDADSSAWHVQAGPRGSRFAVTCADGRHLPNTALIGQHNVLNALAAASATRLLGLQWDSIWKGIVAVERIPGRLEPLNCGQPFDLFLDQANSPAALAAALESLRPVCAGKFICVLGADGKLGSEQQRRMVEVAKRFADTVVLTAAGRDSCTELIGKTAAGFRVSAPWRSSLTEARRFGWHRALVSRKSACSLQARADTWTPIEPAHTTRTLKQRPAT